MLNGVVGEYCGAGDIGKPLGVCGLDAARTCFLTSAGRAGSSRRDIHNCAKKRDSAQILAHPMRTLQRSCRMGSAVFAFHRLRQVVHGKDRPFKTLFDASDKTVSRMSFIMFVLCCISVAYLAPASRCVQPSVKSTLRCRPH